MATSNRYRVPFRRKRTGQTNYRKRRDLLKSRIPRAVVRKTNRNLIVGIMGFDPDGDKTIAYADTNHIRNYGWDGKSVNTSSSYLTGYLAGKRLLSNGVKTCIFDIGLRHPTKGSRIFAALKGLLDSGVEVSHNASVIPDDKRIKSCSDKVSSEIFDEIKNKIDSEVSE